ncbi:unnamed protein product [Ceutorhynchus assimilis]|uniref:Uncharacterized protein n=1 Tax=Ceutorhynchus assimilis TaxID=467358 RepID=A0A9N9MWR1_9CUCU|nr:unnamed protein product [Ceutorhynchus assimilis]
MAATPTTLVLFSEDRTLLPIKSLYAVAKHLFQYGVNDISQKVDKVIVNLTYSPRAATLKRKFGNLPVRYMRTRIDSEEEFKLLEQVVKKFKFNLLDENLEEGSSSQPARLRILPKVKGGKRKLKIDEIFSTDEDANDADEDDDDDDDEVAEAQQQQASASTSA